MILSYVAIMVKKRRCVNDHTGSNLRSLSASSSFNHNPRHLPYCMSDKIRLIGARLYYKLLFED